MNPIAFNLVGPDNNTDMFDDNDPSLDRCPTCGYRLDFTAYNPNYAFKRTFRPHASVDSQKITTETPLTYTYDGQAIVTGLFKQFCEDQGYADIVFRSFPRDPSHYQFLPQQTIAIDPVLTEVQFGKRCPTCGNYDETIKGAPVTLLRNEPLVDGIFRSDLLFAGGDGKFSLILIGLETREKLHAIGFRKLSYHPVFTTSQFTSG